MLQLATNFAHNIICAFTLYRQLRHLSSESLIIESDCVVTMYALWTCYFAAHIAVIIMMGEKTTHEVIDGGSFH